MERWLRLTGPKPRDKERELKMVADADDPDDKVLMCEIFLFQLQSLTVWCASAVAVWCWVR